MIKDRETYTKIALNKIYSDYNNMDAVEVEGEEVEVETVEVEKVKKKPGSPCLKKHWKN